MSIRRKLFLISLLLISTVGVVGAQFLLAELRAQVSARIEEELYRHALVIRGSVGETAGNGQIAAFDALADRLGHAMGGRVTLLGPAGNVIGDSSLPADELHRAGNLRDRADVAAALASQVGDEGDPETPEPRNYKTLRADGWLYLAVPCRHPEGMGAVRVSRPLADVDRAAERLRTLLLFAGVLGLGVAIFMSGVASHLASRNLRQMAERVRALARSGDGSAVERLDVGGQDDMRRLAGSINRMADDLHSTVAALAAERTRFAAVLQDLPNAVIRLDGSRCVRIMNDAALRLLELAEAPIGKPFIEYLRAPAVLELLDHPNKRGSAEFSLPGSERRMVMAHVSPQPSDDGCILVLHDITDVRKLETVRQDFVANVSHELRTPVSIIRANTETLLDGAMDDPVFGQRLVGAVHRNAERLSNIIAELLDLSRLEAGRFHVTLEEASVQAMSERAIDAVERAAQSKNIDISCEIAEDISLHTDTRMCERILINYLDNAIKYTPPGGRIQVRARALEGRVRLEVTDNGPGISEHHRERVFERFYRIDPGRSRSMGGTGLGLSIVKHAGELLGGEVGVDAVDPHGSRFWVSLPLSFPESLQDRHPPVTQPDNAQHKVHK